MTENIQKLILIEEEILTSKRVGEILDIAPKTIDRECREGRLKARKRLGKWYIFKSDLMEFIRQGDIGGEELE